MASFAFSTTTKTNSLGRASLSMTIIIENAAQIKVMKEGPYLGSYS